MRNFTVYFEIYGKKMKATVLAESEEKAKKSIQDKIIFHKVEKANEEFNKSMDLMDDMLNFLDNKVR